MKCLIGAAIAVLAGCGVLVASPGITASSAQAAPCSSFPRPGTTLRAPTPPALGAEYGVLRRPRRRSDVLGAGHLHSLTASDIIRNGIRLVGHASSGGRAYLVPARHLLAFPLSPPRCLPRSERSLERTLLPSLRREYAHFALCLVVVYPAHDSATCDRAPGTFDPLLYGPGSPGFGVAPDGVPAVAVHYFNSPSRRVVVHRNFWIINDAAQLEPPCGVDWVTRTGTVLRRVKSCTVDTS